MENHFEQKVGSFIGNEIAAQTQLRTACSFLPSFVTLIYRDGLFPRFQVCINQERNHVSVYIHQRPKKLLFFLFRFREGYKTEATITLPLPHTIITPPRNLLCRRSRQKSSEKTTGVRRNSRHPLLFRCGYLVGFVDSKSFVGELKPCRKIVRRCRNPQRAPSHDFGIILDNHFILLDSSNLYSYVFQGIFKRNQC
uniref:Uncharacterized protein n=1 Tax=Helianthus annuus TaxID=4232 RepID=A0A251S6E7_HELAN